MWKSSCSLSLKTHPSRLQRIQPHFRPRIYSTNQTQPHPRRASAMHANLPNGTTVQRYYAPRLEVESVKPEVCLAWNYLDLRVHELRIIRKDCSSFAPCGTKCHLFLLLSEFAVSKTHTTRDEALAAPVQLSRVSRRCGGEAPASIKFACDPNLQVSTMWLKFCRRVNRGVGYL